MSNAECTALDAERTARKFSPLAPGLLSGHFDKDKLAKLARVAEMTALAEQ